MKRLVYVLFLLIFFTGCTGAGMEGAQEGSGLKVYASFYAMYDFAKTIGGDRIHLQTLVPAGMEPHDWEPSPKDMANLESSDIFIYNGMGIEGFLEKVEAAVRHRELLFVEAAEGIADTGVDSHVWLDPMHAKKQMQAIQDAFVLKDPINAAYYENNFAKASEKLDILDAAYRTAMHSFSRKDIVVTHQAYGYLCQAYGLNQIAIEGLAADSEPSPARMAEVIDFVNDNQVQYIFFEELASSKVAEAIASETGAAMAVLNPFEGFADGDEEKDYFTVMYENLEVLKKALQ